MSWSFCIDSHWIKQDTVGDLWVRLVAKSLIIFAYSVYIYQAQKKGGYKKIGGYKKKTNKTQTLQPFKLEINRFQISISAVQGADRASVWMSSTAEADHSHTHTAATWASYE